MQGKVMSSISKLRNPVSGLTHLAGMILAIVGILYMALTSSSTAGPWYFLPFLIYGSTLVMLYMASSLYHLLPLSESGVRKLKRLDHIAVFFLIAGSYTPFCLLPLRGPWGWTFLSLVWGLALGGTLFKIVWLNAPRWLVVGIYLTMGWVVVLALVPLSRVLPLGGIIWLFAGGILYSVGAIIYARKWPNPYPEVFGFHEIWHLFVMAGSLSHFWAILVYILPLA